MENRKNVVAGAAAAAVNIDFVYFAAVSASLSC